MKIIFIDDQNQVHDLSSEKVHRVQTAINLRYYDLFGKVYLDDSVSDEDRNVYRGLLKEIEDVRKIYETV